MSRVLRRKLVRDLIHHKAALLALLAMVAVGVGVYVSTDAVYRDMDGASRRYYERHGMVDFTVDVKRAASSVVARVAALPNVRAVRGRVSFPVRVALPGQLRPISGFAISMPERRTPVLNDVLLMSGTWFSGRDDREVILNEAFATARGLRPGSRVRVLLLDKEHDLLVVGTAMSPEFVYVLSPDGGLVPDPARFAVLYLPERFLQQSCGLSGAYNQLIGQTKDTSKAALDNTLRLVEAELDASGVTYVTPSHEQPSVRFVADELVQLQVTADTVPVLFLGVAALVLNVLMRRLVTQQRSIIGTLRGLGYTPGAITRHYLGFGVLIGVLGGVLGIVLGRFLQVGMLGMYRPYFAIPSIEPHVYPERLLIGVGVSIVFAVLGTLKGVRYASRLEPAEAMRPPPPEKGGRVFPERFVRLWAALPFRWKMILRAVFRNPFRSTVGIVATLISAALVLATLAMYDAFEYMVYFEFDRVAHQDYTVSLRDPRSARAISEMKGLAGQVEVEPQLAVVCDLSNGPHTKRLAVTGVRRDARLYTPLDETGRRVAVPEQGLVLSKKLAEILNAAPGDRLRMRPLIGRRGEVETPVVGIADTFLGLSAYADIEYLSRLLGEEWAANVLLCREVRGAEGPTVLSELRRRPAVVGIVERQRSFEQIDETLGRTMTTSLGMMILFAGCIAFGSVLNAAMVSLSEREREVGTLRVLGYTPLQTTAIFSGESYLLNTVGVLLGIVGGIGLAYLMSRAYDTELYRFPTVIHASRLLVTALIMFGFVTLAQLVVYRMIRTLPWLDVLKIKE